MAVLVDCYGNTENIYLLLNPHFMGCNNENWAAFITNLRQKEEEIFAWTWEKQKLKTINFQKWLN